MASLTCPDKDVFSQRQSRPAPYDRTEFLATHSCRW